MDVTGVSSEDFTYRESGCVENNAKSCTLDCNNAIDATGEAEIKAKTREDQKCCESIARNCAWQWLDATTTKGTCMPSVPLGITFWGDENGDVNDEAREICNKRSIEEYKTTWQENAFDHFRWECTGRCEAYTLEYLKANNFYCKSAGDCGAGYNYKGVWNNEVYTRDWDKDPPNENDKHYLDKDDNPETSRIEYLMNNIENGIYGGEIDSAGENPSSVAFLFSLKSGLSSKLAFAEGLGWLSVSLVGIIAVGVVIAMYSAVETLTIAAGMLSAFGPAGWIVGAIAAAIAIILLALTYSADSEERNVVTTCEPWIAPTGGDDCALCDSDPMHPCSEYRCKSLGQNCAFIRENEGRIDLGTCYDKDPNDISRLKIKAWAEDNHPLGLWMRQAGIRTDVSNDYSIEALPADAAIQAGYKIKKASGDGKLPTFSTIEFGIQTFDNEGELRGAQCKYTTEYKPGLTFATMSNWFPPSNSYYSKNHNMTIYGLTSNKIYEYYIICRGTKRSSKRR